MIEPISKQNSLFYDFKNEPCSAKMVILKIL